MRLWVIGDSWTDPAYGGWSWSCGWPQLVAARLRLGLVNSGAGGSGYARVSASGMTHGIQAARGAGAGADVGLLWGSVNDSNGGQPPERVYEAAAATLRLVRAALAPGAPILVIGPQGTDEPPVPLEYLHRDAIAQAAREAGATFLDALHWMLGRSDLMDAVHHPDCAGHELLADLIAPELLWLLSEQLPQQRASSEQGGGWVMPLTVELGAGEQPAEELLPAG